MKNSMTPCLPALMGLRHIKLLQALGDDTLTDIARAAQFRRYGRGQTILSRVDTECDLCLISVGRVRMNLLAPSGREVRLCDMQAGESFGQTAALDHQPACVTVTALQDTLLVCISPPVLTQLLKHHWTLCERLLLEQVATLRRLTERVYELSTMSVRQRLVAELLRQAAPWPGSGHGGGLRVVPAPRHADLAAQVGTSREQISREMALLTRKGLLVREGSSLMLTDVYSLNALREDLDTTVCNHDQKHFASS